MSVSKNRVENPPKWIVYNGKPYVLMDDLGGKTPTPIFGGPLTCCSRNICTKQLGKLALGVHATSKISLDHEG